MAEQIFSARPKNYVSRSQRRYYPRVAVKAGLPLIASGRSADISAGHRREVAFKRPPRLRDSRG
jgi:hypothetical protein